MVKIEPIRPAASLWQASVLRGEPSKVTGLLVLLSSWIIADPLDVFLANFADSFCLTLPSPKAGLSGSGSTVTVPVSGRNRGSSRLRDCYGYQFLISTVTVQW